MKIKDIIDGAIDNGFSFFLWSIYAFKEFGDST